MELEVEEPSQRLGTNDTPTIARSTTINKRECEVYSTLGLGRGNNRRAEEESYLELKDGFDCMKPGFGDADEPKYNGSDQYTCSECNIPKPNARLLDIHVQEVHDSFFKILSERQPMYECYVSECDLKFNNPSERREHCISEHKYSKSFRMSEDRIKLKELEGRNERFKRDPRVFFEQFTKSQKRKNSGEDLEDFEDSKRKNLDSELVSRTSQLEESKFVLAFIPRQVVLRNSYAKTLTNNECLNREILENRCMMDLANALPNDD